MPAIWILTLSSAFMYISRYAVNSKKPDKETKKKLAKKKRKEKFKKIIDAKYAKTGATPPQEYEHMDATIEYIKDGGYYLIMYEKGFIRAWGAIKVKQE